jgi:pyruvate dehydrogenase E2 component (dihydrolipoamide acetyltransferase)
VNWSARNRDDPSICLDDQETLMSDFRMPSLGADMDFGRVVEWNVKVGDRVKRGDIIVEVETDKGTFEIESPLEGTVQEIAVQSRAKVPVGTVLAKINTTGAPEPLVTQPLTVPVATVPGIAGTRPITSVEAPAPSEEPIPRVEPTMIAPPPALARKKVSPLARRMAAELGVDLTSIEGTGAGGAVTKRDVEAAASRAPSRVPATIGRELPEGPKGAEGGSAATAMRRAIAAAVSRSKREIPHYYLSTDLDLKQAMSWLEAENSARPVEKRLLPAALLVKAVALALRRFPNLNGVWLEGELRVGQSINVGIAISLRSGGLIAPSLRDTDAKTVTEVMRGLSDLVQRARSGGLRGSEMTDATITVTNLGDQGVTTVYGVIYTPQVAIVGFGKIVERPWAEQGMLDVRHVVTATLAADHRATDGHYGGLFLAEVGRLLQTPEQL